MTEGIDIIHAGPRVVAQPFQARDDSIQSVSCSSLDENSTWRALFDKGNFSYRKGLADIYARLKEISDDLLRISADIDLQLREHTSAELPAQEDAGGPLSGYNVIESIYEHEMRNREAALHIISASRSRYAEIGHRVDALWEDVLLYGHMMPREHLLDIAYLSADLKIRASGIEDEDTGSLLARRKRIEEELRIFTERRDIIWGKIPYRLPDDTEIFIGELGKSASYKEWFDEANSLGESIYRDSMIVEEIDRRIEDIERLKKKVSLEIETIFADAGRVSSAYYASLGNVPVRMRYETDLRSLLLRAELSKRVRDVESSATRIKEALGLLENISPDSIATRARRAALLIQLDEDLAQRVTDDPQRKARLKEIGEIIESLAGTPNYYGLHARYMIRVADLYLSAKDGTGVEKARLALLKLKGRARDIVRSKLDMPGVLAGVPEWVGSINPEISRIFGGDGRRVIERLMEGAVAAAPESVSADELDALSEALIVLSKLSSAAAQNAFANDDKEKTSEALEDSILNAVLLELLVREHAEGQDPNIAARFQNLIAQSRVSAVAYPLAMCGYFKDSIDFSRDRVQGELPDTIAAAGLRSHNSWLVLMNPSMVCPRTGKIRWNVDDNNVLAAARTASGRLHSKFIGRRGILDAGIGAGGALAGFIFLGPPGAGIGFGLGTMAGEGADTIWSLANNAEYIRQSYLSGVSMTKSEEAAVNYAGWGLSFVIAYPAASRGFSVLDSVVKGSREGFVDLSRAFAQGMSTAYRFWTSPIRGLSGSVGLSVAAARNAGVRGIALSLKRTAVEAGEILASRYSKNAGLRLFDDMVTSASTAWFVNSTAEKVATQAGWMKPGDMTGIFSREFEIAAGTAFILNTVRLSNSAGVLYRASMLHAVSAFIKAAYDQYRSGQGVFDMDMQRIGMHAGTVTFATHLGNVVKGGMDLFGKGRWLQITAPALAMAFATFPMTFILQPLLDADLEYYYRNRLFRHFTTDIPRKMLRFALGWQGFTSVVVDDFGSSLAESYYWAKTDPIFAGKGLWRNELREALRRKDARKVGFILRNRFTRKSYDWEDELEPKDFLALRRMINSGILSRQFLDDLTGYMEGLEKSADMFDQRILHSLALVLISSSAYTGSSDFTGYIEARPHIKASLGLDSGRSGILMDERRLAGLISDISKGRYDHLFEQSY